MKNNDAEGLAGYTTTAKILPFPGKRMRGKDVICIPCAVKQPDFKERAPQHDNELYDYLPAGRAWIKGRSFSLLRHPGFDFRCSQCGDEAISVYEEENE